MEMEKIGEYAFIACIIIAGIAGLVLGFQYGIAEGEMPPDFETMSNVMDNSGWIMLVLVILGIIVSLTTITEKEVSAFLIAAIALIVANVGMFGAMTFGEYGGAGMVGGIFKIIDLVVRPLGSMITFILMYITAFVAPAAVLLALKAVYALAKKA